MMSIEEIEFNNEGMVVAMKGTFKRSKVFSYTTDKILFWAEYDIDYVGW
jgi:hypothetical protein